MSVATCGFVIDYDELGMIQKEAEESAIPAKRGWQNWGDAFRHYRSKDFDEGYCAFMAYEWEKRHAKEPKDA